jgi:hypothetical protein
MSERINLQYTIEIEELSPEVQRLLHGAYDTLKEAVTPLPADPLSLATLEHVDELRQQLMKADYMLRDISSIVAAYLSYKTALSQQEEPAPLQQEAAADESAPEE